MDIYTRLLKDINIQDINEAGGKASTLGKLKNLGFAVPDGYVILSNAFYDFISYNKIDLTRIFTEYEKATQNEIFETIKKKIIAGQLPNKLESEIFSKFTELKADTVAVRSSAIAEDSKKQSWAGQLDSILSVDRTNLIDSIKECWASLFSVRAFSYGNYTDNQKDNFKIAVLIQNMVNAELSGICFSVNPVNKNRSELVIVAGSGLCDGVVNGKTNTDTYILRRPSLNMIRTIIKNKEVSDLGVLKLSQLDYIAKIVLEIELESKYACDIEWSYYDHKLFILQSRPITTL